MAATAPALAPLPSPRQVNRTNGWNDLDRKRQYQKEWVAKRRQEAIDERGGTCQHPGCWCTIDLQFHHLLPMIKVTHRIFSYSRERIKKELEHCQLLCNVHHKKAEREKFHPRQWCGL